MVPVGPLRDAVPCNGLVKVPTSAFTFKNLFKTLCSLVSQFHIYSQCLKFKDLFSMHIFFVIVKVIVGAFSC